MLLVLPCLCVHWLPFLANPSTALSGLISSPGKRSAKVRPESLKLAVETLTLFRYNSRHR
jgi:hypothetical protein